MTIIQQLKARLLEERSIRLFGPIEIYKFVEFDGIMNLDKISDDEDELDKAYSNIDFEELRKVQKTLEDGKYDIRVMTKDKSSPEGFWAFNIIIDIKNRVITNFFVQGI